MKSNYYLFLLLLFILISNNVFLQAQNRREINNAGKYSQPNAFSNIPPSYVHDSSITWEWDTMTNTWAIDPIGKARYQYTSFYGTTIYIGQKLVAGIWENYEQYINTFDANQNWLSQLHQLWNGSMWIDTNRIVFTYDIQGSASNEDDFGSCRRSHSRGAQGWMQA